MTKKSVFIFAHPDDEFGCYESLRREATEGARPICFYLTDGAYGGQSPVKRMNESLSVLASLGVSAEDIHFPGVDHAVRDGTLPDRMLDVANILADRVGHLGEIGRFYAPAWEGGHQDHDAAHLVALAVEQKLKVEDGVWQYSLYHGSGLKGPLFHVLRPLSGNGECVVQDIPLDRRFAYLRLCLGYPSQWKTWLGLFPFVAWRLLIGGRYYLQRAGWSGDVSKPHAGQLLYERRGFAAFSEFRMKARDFISQWNSVQY